MSVERRTRSPDRYGQCPLCQQEGDLEGSCENIDGDERSMSVFTERWECATCGIAWNERFVHVGWDPVED